MTPKKQRILIVDDNREIHEDFRKILAAPADVAGDRLNDLEADLFGGDKAGRSTPTYDMESAYQGQEGYEKVLAAVAAEDRFALAFVDMRMPPGWDGVQTIEKIWEADPEIQIVICSAYSDYSWDAILAKLGTHDRLLILKKPFDTVEVCQLACALTEKWHLAKHAHLKLNQLKGMVDERTADLTAANMKLQEEINDRRRVEQSLVESVNQYQTSFELAAVGKVHVDVRNDRFIRVNRKLCQMTGYTSEELLAMTVSTLTYPDDRADDQAAFDRMFSGASADYVREKRYVCKDGRVIWVNVSAALIRNAAGVPTHTVGVIQDVTDRKLAEEQLRHDAMHDPLTGLANRALLMHQLGRSLTRCKRDGVKTAAVLYLDLDRFKSVNDVLGHLVGDKLLVAVAGRLSDVSRQSDDVSRPGRCGRPVRLGGDEFLLLLEDLNGPEDAVRVAERIREALTRPFQIDGHEVHTHSSVGIAMVRPSYEKPDEILRDADTALYRAKANRGSFALFDQSMHDAALDKWTLENALRRAVERDELELFFQPVLALDTGRVVEFEALVRWNHGDRGLLAPSAFVPLAEESGQIVALGRWVLEAACRQATKWQRLVPGGVPVAVNLSGKQLACVDIVDIVRNTLADTKLPPSLLRLELTESSIVSNTEVAATTVRSLSELGIHMHLDDFGTGYSSLSYLHRIPMNVLKIDRSFVATMHTDATSRSIVQVIINLAKTLGMQVIAEGIETQEQAVALAELKCELGQGYYFSRPLSEKLATEFLIQRSLTPSRLSFAG